MIEKDKTAANETARTRAVHEREIKQLSRLQILIDVIFALLICRIIQILPKPDFGAIERMEILQFLGQDPNIYIMAFIGIVMILIYWSQNNLLFGNLRKTDGKHAKISILQIVFLLIYMYSIRLAISYNDDIFTLAMQSFFLALTGFTGGYGWRYARKDRKLLTDAITDEEAKGVQVQIFAEPLTALFTLPFAFVGPLAWNLAWLLYPVASRILKMKVK